MLEAIRDLKYIGDRPIHRIRLCGRRMHDIEFNTRTNEVRFRLQPGPRKVLGDQGVDPDHIIELGLELIKAYDKRLPDKENEPAIHHLSMALAHLQKRRNRRMEKGVEGTWEK